MKHLSDCFSYMRPALPQDPAALFRHCKSIAIALLSRRLATLGAVNDTATDNADSGKIRGKRTRFVHISLINCNLMMTLARLMASRLEV